MDVLFEELVGLCKANISELRDFNLAPVGRDREPPSRTHRKFDLHTWRQRLEETAKGIDFCGGFLFINSGDMFFTETPQQALRLAKVMEHVRTLVDLVTSLPLSAGRYYSMAVREAAVATLNALTRLPDAWHSARRTRQAPAVFVWNQTLRLRDIPENAHCHILVKWERWAGLLRETTNEIKGLGFPPSSPDSADSNSILGPEFPNETPFICSAERNTTRDVAALLKIIRTLFRKVKSRCLSEIALPSDTDVHFIDEVYETAEAIVREVDLLATLIIPPHDTLSVVESVLRLATLALGLCQLGDLHAGPFQKGWFYACQGRIEHSLSILFRRNPLR